ncbi:MAG TPA: hypothetical protein VIF83_03235 [Gemmatimonadaceae bacterium]
MNKYIMLLISIVAASPMDAQIRRRMPTSTEPGMWASLSAGIYGGNGISDGSTQSTWDFGAGTTWQYRAAVEKAIERQIAVGLVGTYVKVPFEYIGNLGANSCVRCDAHLDVVSLGVSFHAGGGPGLHQILEASAGALQYRNLRRDDDGTALAPLDGNVDPFFTFGYGFGYTFNQTMDVSVVQDYGLALHERKGLSTGQSNTLTQRSTRLNFRIGFGARTRRR